MAKPARRQVQHFGLGKSVSHLCCLMRRQLGQTVPTYQPSLDPLFVMSGGITSSADLAFSEGLAAAVELRYDAYDVIKLKNVANEPIWIEFDVPEIKVRPRYNNSFLASVLKSPSEESHARTEFNPFAAPLDDDLDYFDEEEGEEEDEQPSPPPLSEPAPEDSELLSTTTTTESSESTSDMATAHRRKPLFSLYEKTRRLQRSRVATEYALRKSQNEQQLDVEEGVSLHRKRGRNVVNLGRSPSSRQRSTMIMTSVGETSSSSPSSRRTPEDTSSGPRNSSGWQRNIRGRSAKAKGPPSSSLPNASFLRHMAMHPNGVSFDANVFRRRQLRAAAASANDNATPWPPALLAEKVKQEQTGRLIVGLKRGGSDAKRRRLLATPSEAGGTKIVQLSKLPVALVDLPTSSNSSYIARIAKDLLMNQAVEYVEADSRVWAFSTQAGEEAPAAANEEIPPCITFDLSSGDSSDVAAFMSDDIQWESAKLIKRPNDPLWPQQWYLPWTKAHRAWRAHRGDEEGAFRPIVTIVDTGMDYTHPDLRQNLWVNEKELNGIPGVDDDDNGYVDDIYGINALTGSGDPMDDNSHGTHCAGVIGAAGDNGIGIIGVNRNALLMGCKFLGPDGGGAVSNAVKCIDYAIQMKAHVLSNSWGGGGSRSLREAVTRSREEGLTFIAAAGNFYQNNDEIPTYPANYESDNIISIASVDKRGLSPFSNYGSRTVHVAAPGTLILSTVRNESYATLSGTSMACPAVAGLASLIKSASPDLDYRHIVSSIRLSTRSFANLATLVNWGGVVDHEKALEVVLGPAWYRPVPSWAPYLKPTLLLPDEEMTVPIAFMGLEVGHHSSNFTAVAVGETTKTFQSVSVPVNLTVTAWPRLSVQAIPKQLVIPTRRGRPSLPVKIPLINMGQGTLRVTVRFVQSSAPGALILSVRNNTEVVIKGDGEIGMDGEPRSREYLLLQCVSPALLSDSHHQILLEVKEGPYEQEDKTIKMHISCTAYTVSLLPTRFPAVASNSLKPDLSYIFAEDDAVGGHKRGENEGYLKSSLALTLMRGKSSTKSNAVSVHVLAQFVSQEEEKQEKKTSSISDGESRRLFRRQDDRMLSTSSFFGFLTRWQSGANKRAADLDANVDEEKQETLSSEADKLVSMSPLSPQIALYKPRVWLSRRFKFVDIRLIGGNRLSCKDESGPHVLMQDDQVSDRPIIKKEIGQGLAASVVELAGLRNQDDGAQKYKFSRFRAKFFNDVYDEIFVSPNGFFSFIRWDHRQDWKPSLDKPVEEEPRLFGVVAPLWQDFYLSTSTSGIYVFESDNYLIVQWNDLVVSSTEDENMLRDPAERGIISDTGASMGAFSFQAILLRNGDILYAYKSVPFLTDDVQIGLRSADGHIKRRAPISKVSTAILESGNIIYSLVVSDRDYTRIAPKPFKFNVTDGGHYIGELHDTLEEKTLISEVHCEYRRNLKGKIHVLLANPLTFDFAMHSIEVGANHTPGSNKS